MSNIRIVVILIFFIVMGKTLYAQETENEFQARTKVDVSFKPVKKLKLTLTPELRFDDEFTLDKYLLEGEISSKAMKYLSFAGSYGLVANVRNSKDTEYSSRYAFSAILKKEFNRFEPSFRLMYSNYADDEIDDKKYMRYKAALKYDIANCKITPSAAIQAFQQLNGGGLYKMRYAVGVDYKLFKNNFLGASYKLDYYQNEYKNRHILSIGYKLKF